MDRKQQREEGWEMQQSGEGGGIVRALEEEAPCFLHRI